MLPYLAASLIPHTSLGNVMHYLTFRAGGAILTALILGLVIGPRLIEWLRARQYGGQPIRTDGPASHLETKKGIPTMGGLIILLAFGGATLLWADLNNPYVWVLLFSGLGFGALGALDDYTKLAHRSSAGISARTKMGGQLCVAGCISLVLMWLAPDAAATGIAIPFVKSYLLDVGLFFVPWGMFVLVGASNAANLTDGLDGLLTVPLIFATACFGLIAYLVGNHVFASYLHLILMPGVGELAVTCGAMIGALLAFLWYNAQPAEIFMGDTGSLAAGGMLGTLSVATKHEMTLVIVGGLFVVETLSVILQVFYFKRTRKRIFLMAPLHHHFEEKGWPESKIVVRFWIVALIFSLLGLATLKLR